MDLLKGPIREGSRGGRGEFKWSDVKDSKDREYYLGVSVKAPAGRWQQNRDIQWYAKANGGQPDQAVLEAQKARAEEIRKIKEAENDALSAALGFKVAPRQTDGELSQSEVYRAIREAGEDGDVRDEDGDGKGIGFGRMGVPIYNAEEREVLAGNAREENNSRNWKSAKAQTTEEKDGNIRGIDEGERRGDRHRGHSRPERSRDEPRGSREGHRNKERRDNDERHKRKQSPDGRHSDRHSRDVRHNQKKGTPPRSQYHKSDTQHHRGGSPVGHRNGGRDGEGRHERKMSPDGSHAERHDKNTRHRSPFRNQNRRRDSKEILRDEFLSRRHDSRRTFDRRNDRSRSPMRSPRRDHKDRHEWRDREPRRDRDRE